MFGNRQEAEKEEARKLLEKLKSCPNEEASKILNAIIKTPVSLFYQTQAKNLAAVNDFFKACEQDLLERKVKLTNALSTVDMNVNQWNVINRLMKKGFDINAKDSVLRYQRALIQAPSIEIKQIIPFQDDLEDINPDRMKKNELDDSNWKQLEDKFKGESPSDKFGVKTLYNLKAPVPTGKVLQAKFNQITRWDDDGDEASRVSDYSLILELIDDPSSGGRGRRRSHRRKRTSKRKRKSRR